MYPRWTYQLRKFLPHLAAGVLLVLLGVLSYSNTLHAPFVFDDIPQIQDNESIRITRLSPGQLWAAGMQSPVKGRPLAFATFAINYYFGGENVAGYHVVNIAIHLLAALFAYWLAWLTIQTWSRSERTPPAWLDEKTARRIAFVAAAIFLLHPIQIQSVTYLVQRMNSLATLLYLAAMACYVAGRGSERPRNRRALWTLAAIAWILSFSSKQIAVTFPIVVLMYEWYFFRSLSFDWMPKGWRGRLLLGGTIAIVVAVVALASTAQLSLTGGVFKKYQERDFTMGERLLTQPRVLCIYASLAVAPWPGRFNLLHHIEPSRDLFSPPQTLVAIALLAGYVWLAVWIARRDRLISFCLLWPLVQLSVESSILPLELIYEHRMYLPMFGVALLASTLLFSSLAGSRQAWRAPVVALLVGGLAIATYVRNQVWNDSITLWSDVIAKNPYSLRAYVNRGNLFASQKDWAKAIDDYSRAIALDESFESAWLSRGRIYASLGDRRKAITNFSAAIALAELNDARSKAYWSRGMAWAADGLLLRALSDYTKAIELDPSDPNKYYFRATTYRRRNEYRNAIDDFQRCVDLSPNHAAARNELAYLLATCPDSSLRSPKAAVEHAIRANDLVGWREWPYLDTLAVACSANGELSKAIQWETRAMELAPPNHKPELKQMIDRFRAKLPNRP